MLYAPPLYAQARVGTYFCFVCQIWRHNCVLCWCAKYKYLPAGKKPTSMCMFIPTEIAVLKMESEDHVFKYSLVLDTHIHRNLT